MSKTLFVIPVPPQHIRKLQDPTSSGANRSVGYCTFERLPFKIPMDPNPRQPTEKSLRSSLANEIRKTGSEARGLFHLVNAGVFILADSVDYNNEKGLLSFVIDTEKGQGLYNGGHTLKIIEELVQNGFTQLEDTSEHQYCNFDIQVGVDPKHLADIAEGRNSTVPLKEKTLADFQDKFDWVKDALRTQPYKDKIGYVESHDKPEDIERIICRLTAINPLIYDKDSQPIVAYTSKKRCFEIFIESPEKFKPLATILPSVLELYEHLIVKAKEYYLDLVPGGKFVQWEGAVKQLKRTTDRLPFTEEEVEYRIADGWLIPLLAAFRALVKVKSGHASWVVKPEVIYKRIGGRLIRILYETHTTLGKNPNAVGKYENVYRQLFAEVESELKSYLLEQYKSADN
jgi:AIPR protein